MSTKESKLDKTLSQRGPIYGPYGDQIKVRRDLLEVMKKAYKKQNGKRMPKVYREYIWDLVNKMSRIATSPNHIDSWHDIQGYAKLVENDLVNTGDGI